MDAKEFASAYGEEAFQTPPWDCRCCSGIRTGRCVPCPKSGCFFKGAGRPARVGSEPQCRQYRLRGREVLHRLCTDAARFVPAFVSQKEHYKARPKWCWSSSGGSACRGLPVRGSILRALIRRRPRRLFGTADGALFFATPDILSGLVSWAVYDNNADDAVCTRPSGRDAAPS